MLTEKDQELIKIATDVVKANCDLYEGYNMHVGCAVRAKSGKIYKGINIKTSHSICAEQVAIGQALANGEREFETIVAVSLTTEGEPRIVSPCGLCRYIFEKLNINMDVIVRDINNNNKILKVKSYVR